MMANQMQLTSKQNPAGNIPAKFIVTCAVASLLLVVSVLAPAMFTARSIQNMLVQLGPLGVVAMGQALVILVRGLDLSVATVMATAAVISASFGSEPSALLLVVPTVIVVSGGIGLVNGLLITKRNIEPFLCTLAMLIVVQGIRSAMTRGAPLGDTPQFIRDLGRGMILDFVPINTVLLLGLGIASAFVLRRVIAGRQVYLVGSNEQAARLVGIKTDRITISCYVASSIFAGIAGMVLAGYLNQVDNWVGKGYELDSIVAAVLGGVALTGGAGGTIGALLGAAVLVLLSNFILHLGIPIHFQMIMKGVVVICAVAIYARRKDTR